jgi:hypothetical protein
MRLLKKFTYWLRGNIRRVPEPVETVHSARRLLESGAGDCDDMTVFLLTWARYWGRRAKIALYYRRRGREKIYYHIAPVVSGIAMDVYQEFGELK